MIANRNRTPHISIPLKDKRKFAREAEEMQDEADIQNLLSELKKELLTYPREPEYCPADECNVNFTFTKEFMLKLNYITSKY